MEEEDVKESVTTHGNKTSSHTGKVRSDPHTDTARSTTSQVKVDLTPTQEKVYWWPTLKTLTYRLVRGTYMSICWSTVVTTADLWPDIGRYF